LIVPRKKGLYTVKSLYTIIIYFSLWCRKGIAGLLHDFPSSVRRGQAKRGTASSNPPYPWVFCHTHTRAHIHRKGPDVSLLKRGPNVCRQTRREVYIMYRAGFPPTPIKHLQQNVLLRNNNLCGENQVFIDAYLVIYFLIWKLFMFYYSVFELFSNSSGFINPKIHLRTPLLLWFQNWHVRFTIFILWFRFILSFVEILTIKRDIYLPKCKSYL